MKPILFDGGEAPLTPYLLLQVDLTLSISKTNLFDPISGAALIKAS
jgi:hypothetical protein